MRNRYSELDLDALNVLYEKEKRKLTNALLNGSLWEEVQDQRRLVTTLAIERHKKAVALPDHPAASQIRRSLD